MVKKTAVILGVLALLAVGTGMSWGYTVSKWPVPGIPNTTFDTSGSCLPGSGCEFTLRGPVAPGGEPPIIPGAIHAALSVPFRAVSMVATPLFGGGCPGADCCDLDLGDPAYVVAAVPCTAVNRWVPPCPW
jgi:hypothetical protein